MLIQVITNDLIVCSKRYVDILNTGREKYKAVMSYVQQEVAVFKKHCSTAEYDLHTPKFSRIEHNE